MKTRLIILGLLFVLIVGGGAIALRFVLKAGKQVQDPFQQAVIAYRAKDFDKAEELLLRFLDAKPDHDQAFELLLTVYREQEDAEAILKLATRRTKEAPEKKDGWRNLVWIHRVEGRLEEAERVARSRVDNDPLLLQKTLWDIYELSDAPRDRVRAASAALRYGELVENPLERAWAEVYAAATYRDLAAGVTSEQPRRALEMRAANILDEASDRVSEVLRSQSFPVAELLMARIGMLGNDKSRAEAGRDRVEKSIEMDRAKKETSQPEYLKDLVRFYLRSDLGKPNPTKAFEYSRPLAMRSGRDLLRLVRRFAAAGHTTEALELVKQTHESNPDGPVAPELLLLQARLRLAEKPPRPDLATTLAKQVLAADPTARQVISACEVLAMAGDPEEAVNRLETYQRDNPDDRVAMTLAGRLIGDDARREEAASMVEDIYSRTDGRPSDAASMLRVLGRGGPEAVFGFLDRRIESDADRSATYRLARASYAGQLSVAAKDEAKKEGFRSRAMADLNTLASLAPASVPDDFRWGAAALLAARLKDFELAGQLVAIGFSATDRDVRDSIQVLGIASRTAEAELRATFTGGFRSKLGSADSDAWKVALADVVRDGVTDRNEVLDRVLAKQPVEKLPRLGRRVALGFAISVGRTEKIEALASAILAEKPGDFEATTIMAEVYARTGRAADILKLYDAGVGDSGPAHLQVVQALLSLDRKDEALERAQAYFEEHGEQSQSYVALALALVANEELDKALGILGALPDEPGYVRMRADILRRLEQTADAEKLYWSLARSNAADVEAWFALHGLLAPDRRQEEMLLPVTEAIDAPSVRTRPVIQRALYLLRGMINDSMGRAVSSTKDYVRAIELGERNPLPLNNAAWQIYKSDPEGLDKAKQYIDWALESAPDDPRVNDTAAHIYAKRGEYDTALAFSEKSCTAAPDNFDYLITRARIRADSGDKEAAKAELEAILARKPSVKHERQANELLRSLN